MRIQKIAAIFLAFVLCVGTLASCAQSGTDANGGATPSSTQATTQTEAPTPDKPSAPVDYDAVLSVTFTETIPILADALEYTVGDDGVTVTKYVGSETKIRIPEQIDGVAVVAIAANAFSERTDLKVLILPDGVRSLGEGILQGCEELYALHTPLLGADAAAKQYLGYLFGANTHEDNARDVPVSLEFLSVGNALSSLPAFALYECNDLVVLRLSESIKTLGTYALYACERLESVNVEHLTALEAHAMDSCSVLTHLTFSDQVTSFGLGVLEGCTSLRSLTLPFVGGTRTENTYLAYLFGATVPDFSAGYYPTSLIEIKLLDGCTTLGNYAFFECGRLVYLELPKALTSIGVRAFDGCERLRTLTLPNSLQSIGDNAFFGCTRLQTVTFGEGDGAQLASIGINAFYGCAALTEVALPKGLQMLPASCFADCTALRKIDLGGVRSVGKQAFRNCTALVEVIASDEVTFEEGNDAASKKLSNK